MKKLILIIFIFPFICYAQQTPIFELNEQLGRGINMGNMFEAPAEGDWGNPFRNDYFSKIAEAGFDHVRIPIRWDTPARTQMTAPFTIQPAFLNRIKEVVDLALAEDLMVIINMHHHEALFANPAANKARFLAQWYQIAEFFKDYPEDLLFEVMNEPHAQLTPTLWNEYFAEALGEIRKNNPTRAVLMGTAEFGGVSGIFHLDPPADENLIVTVHYYNPFTFTHQGAEWVGEHSQNWLGTKWHDLKFERDAIIQEISPLLSFSEERKIPVHMGEFGAYSKADLDSRVRWTTFLARYLESIGFSWAYWEWSAGFGIYNPQTNQFLDPLLNALLHDTMPEAKEAYPIVLYESSFTASNDGWNLFTQSNAQAAISRENSQLKINVQQKGTENWHVQLAKGNIALENDKLYRISFEGKADQAISVNYYTGKASAPFNSYSGYQNAVLSENFKSFSTVFTMRDPSDAAARFVFDLGMGTGTAYFKNIKVEELNLLILATPFESKEKAKIYPNPVKDRLKIEQILPGTTIELYSMIGALVSSEIASGNSHEIQMKDLAPGVYLLRLKNQNQWEHYRIIKEL